MASPSGDREAGWRVTQAAATSVVDGAPSPDAPGIKHRAIDGAIWTVAGFGVSQALRFGTNIALSHLLAPAVFGLMALVQAVLQGLQMFSDIGIGPNIIQSRRGEERAFLNTAWTVQVIRGVLIALVAALAAAPVAYFYNPDLLPILPVAALGQAILGFTSTASFRLSKRLSLRLLVVYELIGQVAGLVVAVAWALVHPTIWAIIGGALVGNLLRVMMSHTLLKGERDGFGLEREALRQLLTFGGWVFLSTVLTFGMMQGDKLILAKLIPIELFGLYNIAWMLTRAPVDVAAQLGRSVAFPAFSQAIEGGKDFASAFARVRMPVAVVGLWAVAGIAAAGPDLVLLVYDQRYARASVFVPLLAAAHAFQALEVVSGAALLAHGRAKLMAFGNAVKLVALGACVPAGFFIARAHPALGVDPVEGAIAGYVAADVARYLASAWFVHRMGLRVFRHDLAYLALAAGAWGVAAFGVDAVLARVAGLAPGTPGYHAWGLAIRSLVVTLVFARPLLLAARRIWAR